MAVKTKNKQEQPIDVKIARSAARAFNNARQRALQSGISVLVVENGRLVCISPDGERKQVGKVAAAKMKSPLQLKKGQPTTIRWKKSGG